MKSRIARKLEFCPSDKQLSHFAPLWQVLVFLYLLGKQIPCKWDWESDWESCQTCLARKSSCPRWLDSTFFKNLINYQVLKISALRWLEDECSSNLCMHAQRNMSVVFNKMSIKSKTKVNFLKLKFRKIWQIGNKYFTLVRACFSERSIRPV